jgi:hypothetical protein
MGRINLLFSIYYILNIRYDMDRIENTASNNFLMQCDMIPESRVE